MGWDPDPERDATGNVLPHDDLLRIPSDWGSYVMCLASNGRMTSEDFIDRSRTLSLSARGAVVACRWTSSRPCWIKDCPQPITPFWLRRVSFVLQPERRANLICGLALNPSRKIPIMAASGNQIRRFPKVNSIKLGER